jgi:hypothetical protein
MEETPKEKAAADQKPKEAVQMPKKRLQMPKEVPHQMPKEVAPAAGAKTKP